VSVSDFSLRFLDRVSRRRAKYFGKIFIRQAERFDLVFVEFLKYGKIMTKKLYKKKCF